MGKMAEKQVEASLIDVPEWAMVGEAIQRTFHFPDFVAAMRFVTAVAEAAERARHHPDFLIRYNKVTLTLATHDAGGITEKDFELAREVDRAFALSEPPPPVASGPRKRTKA